jgi:hypothetical protein
MSSKHETRKPEPKKTPAPTRDKDTELQVEELEERIAPLRV